MVVEDKSKKQRLSFERKGWNERDKRRTDEEMKDEFDRRRTKNEMKDERDMYTDDVGNEKCVLREMVSS